MSIFKKSHPLPCCKDGHRFQLFRGVLLNRLVCVRCGKKVRGVGE